MNLICVGVPQLDEATEILIIAIRFIKGATCLTLSMMSVLFSAQYAVDAPKRPVFIFPL